MHAHPSSSSSTKPWLVGTRAAITIASDSTCGAPANWGCPRQWSAPLPRHDYGRRSWGRPAALPSSRGADVREAPVHSRRR